MGGHLHPVGRESPENQRIRVLLAEAHARLRRSLRELLEREHDMDVIAEASDLNALARQLRAHQPEVLVLDARMPDGSIVEGIRQLRAQTSRTQIVLITMDNNRTLAEHALTAGALGFVLKDSAETELCTAVRSAARRQRYTSPRVDGAWSCQPAGLHHGQTPAKSPEPPAGSVSSIQTQAKPGLAADQPAG